MIALEMETFIIDHRISVASDLLPASARHAKVIVMYEKPAVGEDAAPDILALVRAAQASFPKQDDLGLQLDLQAMRGEWERKL